MDFTLLLASFGGGFFAAAIGGVPSFVFTGLTVVAVILAGDFGAPAIGIVSFGPWFAPSVAFAGAVAAAGYAKKIGVLENGADIITPLAGIKEPTVLLVGGVFGILGYLVQYVLASLIGENIFGLAGWTDTVALTVVISGIIARLLFTKSGLTGKTPDGVKRNYIPQGKDLTHTLVIGLGFWNSCRWCCGSLWRCCSSWIRRSCLSLFTNGSLCFWDCSDWPDFCLHGPAFLWLPSYHVAGGHNSCNGLCLNLEPNSGNNRGCDYRDSGSPDWRNYGTDL
jgi:hypothetical protein